ncbi:CLUMA_CG018777, isoform A [Clunio marinus]|uniref:CLUMA_CG018777, isoform A n=1 Tax=Clunio marinus TaxID=568069 RepID=A0A1J1J1V9_9DIPT|nr:CLUMA_CG018777, isoform A [Clunio marinus]
MVIVPNVQLNNGLTMPIFGLGTWGSPPGQVEQAVKDAIDAGYRSIDCAHVYRNEHEVGTAVNEKISEGVVKREDLFITSKLWNTFHHPKSVRKAIETSLKNLKLSYLDLYLVHWPMSYKEDGDNLFPKDNKGMFIDGKVDYVDTWKAMEELVDAGLTKSIGISNFNKGQIERLVANARILPATNQVECHPYLNQKRLKDFCETKKII